MLRVHEMLEQSKTCLTSDYQVNAKVDGQVILIYSKGYKNKRACVQEIRKSSLNEAIDALKKKVVKFREDVVYLEISVVTKIIEINYFELINRLENTRRTYFRYGVGVGNNLKYIFTEKESNANALFYGGNKIEHCVFNFKNFKKYAKKKYLNYSVDCLKKERYFLFDVKSVFLNFKTKEVNELYSFGLNAGRRKINSLTPVVIDKLITASSEYLAKQVDEVTGRFRYGWHPCFDRYIDHYNTLRHASSVYAMLEAWSVTKSEKLMVAIKKAISYLVENYILIKKNNDVAVAFLIDLNEEIKLGGVAACLLMLCKYYQVSKDDQYVELSSLLAKGILYMQQEDGSFVHVLNSSDLTVKEKHRIVYYDGEAIYALMLFCKTESSDLILNAAEKAMDYCILNNYEKYHDHWLAYAIRELVLVRPSQRYYQFAIDNVRGYLGFISNRVTTFPTLLELMVATHDVIQRVKEKRQYIKLLDYIDLERFYNALHVRAEYLLNGFFWPEYAMYFKNPTRIEGGFFIRHQAFRVRIDDVQHYLSGLIGYKKIL